MRRSKTTIGRLRRDGDGHWYAVPESQLARFDEMLSEIEGKEYLEAADWFDAFNNEFGECRIDGYRDVSIVIPEDS